MLVSQNLSLDMARPIEETLEETFATPEGGLRLADCRVIEFGHLFHLPGDLKATPAAAMGGFDRDGKPVLLGKGHDLFGRLDRTLTAGHQRCANGKRDPPRLDLVAECFDHMRVRADPGEARLLHRTGEFRPFGEKTVTRVHGIRAGAASDVDELLNVEIGLCRTAAAKTIGLVCQGHEQRIHVRVGIDGDGLEPVVAAGADDAHGNLAAIGNQHFLHRGLLTVFFGRHRLQREIMPWRV